MRAWLRITIYGVVILFALIGLLFTIVFIGMQFGVFNVRGSIDLRNQFFTGSATSTLPSQPCVDASLKTCEWNATPEWAVVASGLGKDASIISKVSGETGISGRLMATVVVPEQLRFFTAEREVYKRYFEPLKILGSLSQFSLGVSGIKQETAVQIETYANDPASPFYPGDGMKDLIAYAPGAAHDTELYNRLTDSKNHYYSYLYTALYLKEIEAQWKSAGFDITGKPDILATLFNIGFQGSSPKANPVAAGAPVTVGGKTYAFGTLGGIFFDSNELTDIFPK